MIRIAGAVLGALFALLGLAALFLISAVPAIDAVLELQFSLSPDGLAEGDVLALVVAWSIAPLAGAVAGALLGPRAAAGEVPAGAWMGFATFYLATALASVALALNPAAIAPPGVPEVVLTLPLVLLVGTADSAPLLVACAGGGLLWGAALRAALRRAGIPLPVLAARRLPKLPLIAVLAIALAIWIVLRLI